MRRLSILPVLFAVACGSAPSTQTDTVGDDVVDEATGGGEVPVEATVDVGPGDDTAMEAAPEIPAGPRVVRFVHISDLHVHGAPPLTSSGDTQKVVEILNGLAFPADFVAATGDFVDYLPDGVLVGDTSAYGVALDLLKTLKWPLKTMAGNHEYYDNDQLAQTQDKAARDAFLVASMGHPLDDSFDLNGVRFVLLDSMSGNLWETDHGLVGSYTDAQLAWLRGKLADGLPTIVFTHHPPNGSAKTPGGDTLCDAIGAGGTQVKAIFAGHLHGFWKGEACGRPYYLVGNGDPTKTFHYEVEYDADTATLTLVNEKDIPFEVVPTFECDATTGTVADPTTTVDRYQVMHVGNIVTNLPGLESTTGAKLEAIPPVLRMDSWDAATSTWHARLTLGRTSMGYITYLKGGPCATLDLKLTAPCVVSTESAFELNALPVLGLLLGLTVDPTWKVRLDVRSLWIEGHMNDVNGTPGIDKGLLHLAASGTKALGDLKGIVVNEYCTGKISGCAPGTTGNPACPALADELFFDQVPEACDVPVGTLSVRLLLNFLAAYPLDNLVIVGDLTTDARPGSSTAANNTVSNQLFATSAGMNCAP